VKSGIILAGDALNIQVDRAKAALEGIDPNAVTTQAEGYLEGTVQTQVQRGPKMVAVRVWTPAPVSIDTDGTAYVESTRPGGPGKIGLWRIQPPLPGQPSVAEHLGGSMDSGTWDSDPYVSPDGKQLFFSSGRPGGCGGADLYVTTPDGNGGWTTPVNLNAYCPGINTGAIEYGPSLSPDGRYLFFVRLDPKEKQCDVWWVANPFAPKPAK